MVFFFENVFDSNIKRKPYPFGTKIIRAKLASFFRFRGRKLFKNYFFPLLELRPRIAEKRSNTGCLGISTTGLIPNLTGRTVTAQTLSCMSAGRN